MEKSNKEAEWYLGEVVAATLHGELVAEALARYLLREKLISPDVLATFYREAAIQRAEDSEDERLVRQYREMAAHPPRFAAE